VRRKTAILPRTRQIAAAGVVRAAGTDIHVLGVGTIEGVTSMRRIAGRRNAIAAIAVVVVGGGALSGALLAQGASNDDKRLARASLVNAAGESVGSVRFERRGKGQALRVTVVVHKLSPGYHGFHVHTTGKCEGPSFMTAGPHLTPAMMSHPNHAGDMPPLLVTSGGKAEARFTTDRFTIAQLRDADGSAAMIHALPDNAANIPKDRYDPDPDAMTLATGDSGPRVACGVVR